MSDFPAMGLPITPPYPPMEAGSVERIPSGDAWVYEPKWDGFRCLAFRDRDEVALQSKAGQPLGRYFPEIVAAVKQLPAAQFVLDGEIVIVLDGKLSFDDMLMRIHPAASRVQKLAAATPARLLAFDLLVDPNGQDLTALPLKERRAKLEAFAAAWPDQARQANDQVNDQANDQANAASRIELSPVTSDRRQAEAWMTELGAIGCDGVVAKRTAEHYHSGDREAMQKIKRLRTADCVVGGYRYASGKPDVVGSLLLGLYNAAGTLDHIGFTSSFTAQERSGLNAIVEPLRGGSGFTGRAPGGQSRWSTERTGEWEPLEPALVCEVRFDHFSGGRFRHGTKLLRWRPDKAPTQCTIEQVR